MSGEVQLAITTVQYGEPVMADDVPTLAPSDLVLMTQTTDGHPIATMHMTPEQALVVARELTTAAVKLINRDVDDTGKPTTLAHRLTRINNARNS